MHRLKNIRWLAPMLLLAIALLAVPSAIEGGRRYSGIDPIITVNNHQFNIRIEYPSEYDCSLVTAIQVTVRVPYNTPPNLLTESIGTLGGCTQVSTTTFIPSLETGNIDVSAIALTAEPFPMKLKVDMDGTWVALETGTSNQVLTIRDVEFDGNADLGIDPVLVGLPPGTMQYTYYDW